MCLEGILASLEDDGTQSFPHPCTLSNGASLCSSSNVWSSLCAPGKKAHHSGQAWRNCSPVRQHVKKQEEEVEMPIHPTRAEGEGPIFLSLTPF